MKYWICIIFFVLSSEYSFAQSGSLILKPSLTVQMQKNTILQKKIFIEEKKQYNRSRVAINKRERKTPKSPISSVPLSNPILTPPKIHLIPQNSSTPPQVYTDTIKNVDMNRVRTEWLGWYNGTRSSLWLAPYSYGTRLDVTAHDWNIEFARGKWQNHHRRSPSNSDYDFPVIDRWFEARGIDPIVIDRSKHTENVGYGYYSCNTTDCTDELIHSIRSTYDFFMSEKGRSYDAHYRSIVQPNFSKIGLDIITVPSDNRYYITIHYITE